MPPRAKNEWRKEPYPGHPLYHLKWTHGVWVSEKATVAEQEAIHRQLHEPPPEGWKDNGTWHSSHHHERPAVQLELDETEDELKW